jgi:hypothetical protein
MRGETAVNPRVGAAQIEPSTRDLLGGLVTERVGLAEGPCRLAAGCLPGGVPGA